MNNDFLCLTEHWLTDTQIEYLNIDGYSVISSFCRSNHLHGGSAILVRGEMTHECKEVVDIKVRSLEMNYECSAIEFRNKQLLIIAIYRPPLSDISGFLEFLDNLLNNYLNEYENLVICGDLNINGLNTECHYTKLLKEILASYDLVSSINTPTRINSVNDQILSATQVDYIISNLDDIIIATNDEPGFSDHLAQYIEWAFSSNNKVASTVNVNKRLSPNGNSISEFLYWYNKYSLILPNVDNFEHSFRDFYTHFKWCYEVSHPITAVKKHDYKCIPKQVISNEIKNEVCILKYMNWYRKFSNDPNCHSEYKKRKTDLNHKIDNAKVSFFNKTIANANNKPKKIWEIVNDRLKSNKQVKPDNIVFNREIISDAKQIANIFADYFTKQAKIQSSVDTAAHDQINTCTLCKPIQNSCFLEPFEDHEILQMINNMKNNVSVSIDEIPMILVKTVGEVIAPYLSEILNISLQVGVFPNVLKIARTVPIYKKGDKNNIENFRGISILSPFSKIMEYAVYNRLIKFLNKYCLLAGCQHGFRKGFSTETATAKLVQCIHDKLDSNMFVAVICFDISKAFDSINHSFLQNKLNAWGIRGNLNKWLISFCENRKIIVDFNKQFSYPHEVNIGTPQGSTLGPLLFLLYMNDLPEFLQVGELFMYADDCSVVISGRSYEELVEKKETVFSQFLLWCEINHLKVNVEKSTYMEFERKFAGCVNNMPANISIKSENKINFLGSSIDAKLSWSEQISFVCKKLNKAYFAILSLKTYLHNETLLSIYHALAQSAISYNIVSWGQATDWSRVFIHQKRIIRMIFNIKKNETCKNTFKSYKILTVVSIFLLKILTYIHNNFASFTKRGDCHDYNIRQGRNICLKKFNYSRYKKSPDFYGCSLYNKLPSELKDANNSQFKRRLKSLLAKHAFYDIDEFTIFIQRLSIPTNF